MRLKKIDFVENIHALLPVCSFAILPCMHVNCSVTRGKTVTTNIYAVVLINYNITISLAKMQQTTIRRQCTKSRTMGELSSGEFTATVDYNQA